MAIQRQTKAELQMLREFFWHFGRVVKCCFCFKPLAECPPDMAFGHRRHPPVDVEISMHHRNRDRAVNGYSNIAPCHRKCHERYHAAERAKVAAQRRQDAPQPVA